MRVVYHMSGRAHLPYLVVSLYTLRNYYGGPVGVYCWEESYDLVKQYIEPCRNLEIECHRKDPELRRRDGIGSNSQFFSKIKLMQKLDGGPNVYADADTTFHGKVDGLARAAYETGFSATQFNRWQCNGNRIGKRIRDLKQFHDPEIDRLVDEVTTQPHPSVNGGIFSCFSDSKILVKWHELCLRCKSTFIADEKVLHLFNAQEFQQDFQVAKGGQYNCSVMYQPEELPDDEVVIYHYHGSSNCRPQKSKRGFEMWVPYYRECMEQNIGGIREWIGEINNRHMKESGLLTKEIV